MTKAKVPHRPKNDREIVCRLCHLLTATDPCGDCSRQPRSVPPKPQRRLTPRETEVVSHLVCGHPNRITAKDLCISEKTVEAHRANINRKLGVKGSVVELALKAILRGYVAMPIEYDAAKNSYGAGDDTELVRSTQGVWQKEDGVILGKEVKQ